MDRRFRQRGPPSGGNQQQQPGGEDFGAHYDQGDLGPGPSFHPDGDMGNPIAVLSDKREIHFVVNTTHSTGIHRVTEQRFVFIGLRQVQFQDTQVLMGWCSDAQCRDTACHAADILSGTDFLSQTDQSFFSESPNRPRVCQRAQELLNSWGGWAAMAMLRNTSEAEPVQGLRRVEFLVGGGAAEAVQLDARLFGTWAVLLKHRGSDGWFCTSCDRRHACQHLLAVHGEEAAPHATLSQEDFEHKLRQDFDVHTGRSLIHMSSSLMCLQQR